MNPVLAALATLIQPAINYAEQKLASIGAAVMASWAQILNTLGNDERALMANVQAYWHAQYDAAVKAGENPLAAVGTASAHALGEFIKEEGQEGSKIVQLTVTGMELAVENSLKQA